MILNTPVSHVPRAGDDAGAVLPLPTRWAIVATTLAQGLLLYIVFFQVWGKGGMLNHVAAALLFAVPGFFVLSVRDIRDRLLWLCVTVVAAVAAGLCVSVWCISGATGRMNTDIWEPWLLALGMLLFIALAWVQGLMQWRNLRRVPYADLFTHAWNNAMVLGFALAFVGLCWLVLRLWAGLFSLVQVPFFAELFGRRSFVFLSTGLMAGLGLVIARGQPRPMRVVLELLLALFRLLLPLLALVLVLFVLTLPFTGLQPLWDTRRAAPLLMSVLLGLILTVNAVYQDGGRTQAPYPALLRLLVDAALVLMPVFAGLALWAVALRVRQYGWTQERVWAAVMAVVLLLYALGYAAAALARHANNWLQGVAGINRFMSWVVMVLIVLLHTPLLDPNRIGAQSQYDRLAQGTEQASRWALQNLAFDHGRHGNALLRDLQRAPAFAQGQAQQDLQWAMALKAKDPGVWRQEDAENKDWRRWIAVAPGHAAPDEAWWQALNNESLRYTLDACAPTEHSKGAAPPDSAEPQCVALQLQLRQGEPAQQLVCYANRRYQCIVFDRGATGAWRSVGRIYWDLRTAKQQSQYSDAVRQGKLVPVPPRWQDVGVQGVADFPAGQMQ